ncbi:hypothetical protein DBV05_g6052 [Lasiodiplodia theobromae]|uniref:Uncharacterized protein n=1 Tax=Lasiodiplodia theobromae TaxID=45133 RepID=A0A5N5DEE0_9PEZI|nr:hypothetical protein DBV05_g6052 [Lasiodiplodia theobromae]
MADNNWSLETTAASKLISAVSSTRSRPPSPSSSASKRERALYSDTVLIHRLPNQPFQGAVVAAAKSGPPPIPHKTLNADNLARAIRYCLTAEAAAAARAISEKMRPESGVKRAVESFHANLPLADMRCGMLPDRQACWKIKKCKLSKEAAGILVANARVELNDLPSEDD